MEFGDPFEMAIIWFQVNDLFYQMVSIVCPFLIIAYEKPDMGFNFMGNYNFYMICSALYIINEAWKILYLTWL